MNLIIIKIFRKVIRFRNEAKRSEDPVDIGNYKKQRTLAVSLNRQTKSRYFNKIPSSENSRPFWDTCKPYFSNKHASRDSKIILIEKDKK